MFEHDVWFEKTRSVTLGALHHVRRKFGAGVWEILHHNANSNGPYPTKIRCYAQADGAMDKAGILQHFGTILGNEDNAAMFSPGIFVGPGWVYYDCKTTKANETLYVVMVTRRIS